MWLMAGGRALRGAPHAGAPGGAVLPVLGRLQQPEPVRRPRTGGAA